MITIGKMFIKENKIYVKITIPFCNEVNLIGVKNDLNFDLYYMGLKVGFLNSAIDKENKKYYYGNFNSPALIINNLQNTKKPYFNFLCFHEKDNEYVVKINLNNNEEYLGERV